jgi:hypothetical protein
MYRRILAFNYDDTLAENGIVPPALQTALERLKAAGYVLFMVTGRRFGHADLGALRTLFSGIVWENGAVLHHTATDEFYLPFGQIDPRLTEALQAAGVPLEHGRAIVFTQEPYDQTVWQVLSRWGGDAVIVRNKGSIRILPSGAAKGAGLERLLGLCGYSPRNLISFGDGESDLSLLALGEIGVAVANAVPQLKQTADLVTAQPGPAGVLNALETYWLKGDPRDIPWRRKRLIPLGEDKAGEPVSMTASALTDGNLGLFGDSGSGKSWVAGLLAEGMHLAGYQILLIDPEGDFRGLRALPGMVALEVTPSVLPPATMVARLLETMIVSVVLDLCNFPVAQRHDYVADLLRALHPLRARKFRPHWILLEEAQYFLPPQGNPVLEALPALLADGGWAFVSYCPGRLAEGLLAALDHCIVTRLSQPESVQTVERMLGHPPPTPLADLPRGRAWLSGEQVVRLRPNARRVPHIRHLYKYLDKPLPAHKRFYFRDEESYIDLEAANLFEFLQCLRDLPIESLVYHYRRDDFSTWAEEALGDHVLADHLHKLGQRSLQGERLRQALLQRVSAHYDEIRMLR